MHFSLRHIIFPTLYPHYAPLTTEHNQFYSCHVKPPFDQIFRQVQSSRTKSWIIIFVKWFQRSCIDSQGEERYLCSGWWSDLCSFDDAVYEFIRLVGSKSQTLYQNTQTREVQHRWENISDVTITSCAYNELEHNYLHGAEPFWEAKSSPTSQNIPAFYGTQMFITEFTTARHLSLSWTRSIQSMRPIQFPHDPF
jgi:hypothetical protein